MCGDKKVKSPASGPCVDGRYKMMEVVPVKKKKNLCLCWAVSYTLNAVYWNERLSTDNTLNHLQQVPPRFFNNVHEILHMASRVLIPSILSQFGEIGQFSQPKKR